MTLSSVTLRVSLGRVRAGLSGPLALLFLCPSRAGALSGWAPWGRASWGLTLSGKLSWHQPPGDSSKEALGALLTEWVVYMY